MQTDGKIYVITNLEVNHNPNSPWPHRRLPIDKRLLGPNYIFYLTDETPIPQHTLSNYIVESELDPLLHQAGKNHLAEWSFLLAEEKHSFCSYPFFMISSRFYMKNDWLLTDLNKEWELLFSYFQQYSHGFLPSYCRPMRWVKLASLINNPQVFFPYTKKFMHLVETLYQTNIPNQYSVFPDLGCHYLGFRDRKALLDYLAFYKPLIEYFFNADFSLKKDLADYTKKSGHFPNEKPLTFIFEILSHLYFFKKNVKFFALHYDGYYDIDFSRKKLKRIHPFSIHTLTKIKRILRYRYYWIRTEGYYYNPYALMLHVWRKLKFYFPSLQALRSK